MKDKIYSFFVLIIFILVFVYLYNNSGLDYNARTNIFRIISNKIDINEDVSQEETLEHLKELYRNNLTQTKELKEITKNSSIEVLDLSENEVRNYHSIRKFRDENIGREPYSDEYRDIYISENIDRVLSPMPSISYSTQNDILLPFEDKNVSFYITKDVYGTLSALEDRMKLYLYSKKHSSIFIDIIPQYEGYEVIPRSFEVTAISLNDLGREFFLKFHITNTQSGKIINYKNGNIVSN